MYRRKKVKFFTFRRKSCFKLRAVNLCFKLVTSLQVLILLIIVVIALKYYYYINDRKILYLKVKVFKIIPSELAER